MAEFHIGDQNQRQPADHTTDQRNSRIGLILFAFYSLAYAGFIILSAFAAAKMETKPLAGINLAILYGFSLIAGALIVSLLYGWLCRRSVRQPSKD
jgi:uncharacterized membrane protein (DUF485 family)